MDLVAANENGVSVVSLTGRIDSSIDLVTQIAETFWISKALMNQRLRDYMEHLA